MSLFAECLPKTPPTPTVSTDTKLWMGAVGPAVSVAIDSVVGSQVGQAAVNARPGTGFAVLRAAKDASARAEAYFYVVNLESLL
ncbi:hypothetical protein GB937_008680 [Aspergillus fischeri]|nr:hypothetical protein GB937_008680 [Aspergillus fischeri]